MSCLSSISSRMILLPSACSPAFLLSAIVCSTSAIVFVMSTGHRSAPRQLKIPWLADTLTFDRLPRKRCPVARRVRRYRQHTSLRGATQRRIDCESALGVPTRRTLLQLGVSRHAEMVKFIHRVDPFCAPANTVDHQQPHHLTSGLITPKNRQKSTKTRNRFSLQRFSRRIEVFLKTEGGPPLLLIQM
jgi:hypothetical protein